MKSLQYGSYLVCHNNLEEVRDFLSSFFESVKGKYNHDTWVTFKVPNTGFIVNLMEGIDQDLTQNMTFEICCSTFEELESYAKQFNKEIKSFISTQSSQEYTYYYIEISSVKNICKVEISYSKDV